MKAFQRARYGGPEQLELREIDIPAVKDDQVLVRVRASSANAHDWHMLRGKPYLARLSEGFRRPKTPEIGLDVAGVVEAVGAAVTHLKPGDQAFGSRFGAYAELVAGKNMMPMPAGLTFEQAAAIPTAGFTALQGLRDKGQLQPGQRVAINGAGGGVGTLAVQIARALGAEVTAVTGPRSLDAVRSLGADRVLDYSREDFTREPGRYDLILDIGGNRRLSDLRRALSSTGRIVMVAPQPGNWIGPIARIAGATVTTKLGRQPAIPYLAVPNREDLAVLARMVEAGQLRPVIDRSFPFDQIPDAIRYLESGQVTGKVVITF
ncbi:MAG TPA: NAD(P)-dependent alcohol dehydrogenase [Candidatus Limnocylindria bacterium]|nr:NAD(P)-dependent alcohol dehydrogenase [Candidatus Limnocylindria bacterium]